VVRDLAAGGLLKGTIANLFSLRPGLEATTADASNPLVVFFRPSAIALAQDGKNSGNEAMVFHEALHGITNLTDSQLETDLLGHPTNTSDEIDKYN